MYADANLVNHLFYCLSQTVEINNLGLKVFHNGEPIKYDHIDFNIKLIVGGLKEQIKKEMREEASKIVE